MRRLASGTEVWRCLGHEAVGPPRGDDPEPDWPPFFADKPLLGKTFVEAFSGHPRDGGANLSRAWEAAGGTAVRYDILINPDDDFLKDDAFWEQQEREPADVYHFGIPCTRLTLARTPKTRSTDNPYGCEADPADALTNQMARVMARRIVTLVMLGCLATVENPLFSFLWLMDELLILAGCPGFRLVRTDHCMYTRPYQKPQLWLTNIVGMEAFVNIHDPILNAW